MGRQIISIQTLKSVDTTFWRLRERTKYGERGVAWAKEDYESHNRMVKEIESREVEKMLYDWSRADLNFEIVRDGASCRVRQLDHSKPQSLLFG